MLIDDVLISVEADCKLAAFKDVVGVVAEDARELEVYVRLVKDVGVEAIDRELGVEVMEATEEVPVCPALFVTNAPVLYPGGRTVTVTKRTHEDDRSCPRTRDPCARQKSPRSPGNIVLPHSVKANKAGD